MIPENRVVHIISGGTFQHVRRHTSLCSMAFGETGRTLQQLCLAHSKTMDVELHLTRMASGGQGKLETNEDVADLVDQLVIDPLTKILFLPVALADYKGRLVDDEDDPGKGRPRLQTRVQTAPLLQLTPTAKIINTVRAHSESKRITVVGFKATSGYTEDQQYFAALSLLKDAGCNLVLANDDQTRVNMVVVPEEAIYPKEGPTTDRLKALTELVEIAYHRSHLTFTQSTVVDGEPVPWTSPLVPETLRTVVDWLIRRGVYRPFQGKTAGHFAAKLNDTNFLTSQRKTNFNDLATLGLVRIETSGPDTVLAYGAKPSVGGQSQRIVFRDHPGMDCIAHFHCPIRPGSEVPSVSQREFECGSHECGQNTSSGLRQFGNLLAVYLDNHGPNLVFNHAIDPAEVISFAEANFDLDRKTGGSVSLPDVEAADESVA